MNEAQPEIPFKNLGDRLKTIRQKLHESVSEVSGAVEIDEQKLQNIEQGHERPSEDILLLLINHFGIHDDDATALWQLAGYDQPSDQDTREEPHNSRTMVMIMAVDPRIIYSDGVQITANNSGVVLNFSQGVGTPQVLTTARIGMSRENATALIHALQQGLEGSKPKQLPPPSSSEKEKQPRSSSDSNKKRR